MNPLSLTTQKPDRSLVSLPSLKQTIHTYGLDARKSLGQHFLLDENITSKIVHLATPLSGHTVIEIGPGPGGLTRSLLNAGVEKLVAVEKDSRCIAALQQLQTAYPGKLEIIEADAMELRLTDITPGPRKIVANLPYNVGTQLLIGWLKDIAVDPSAYASLTLMFQREVAERITASPADGKAYGRVSVLAKWLCTTSHHFDLPPGAFSPPPKVHSSVISLVPREKPLVPAQFSALEKVLAAAFSQRRKMLRSALKPLGAADALLEKSGIDGTRRGETLSVEEFCQLANIFSPAA